MKGKMYSNPPRKPMMYGGMSTKKGAQMGGMQTSSDMNMRPNKQKKQPQGMNYQMAMTSAYPQQAGMMYGGMAGKKKMAAGGRPMAKDPKTGEMKPTYAMDGKGKMMYGGKSKKK